MTNPKKPEPNPIEEAIGERAKPKGNLADLPENAKLIPLPQLPSEIPDEPSPSEMLSLEELNRQTEERLRDQYPEEQAAVIHTVPKVPIIPVEATPQKTIKDVLKETIPIPVSKLDRLPVTKTSSPESPPQKDDDLKIVLTGINEAVKTLSVEDIEFTALKKYILEDGFVLATVAFHIVSLCAQPMTTPSTTSWDFKDRAMIPDMVLALLNQPGYIEGIWPSLRIVMSSSVGNAAWCAGIATTIAFFDVVRTLPALKELQNESI